MKELTKAEEQIMQILWSIERGFVKDIIGEIAEPKPAYNTVSTIVRILETKGFVAHEEFGKSHRYYPLVSKKEYTRFKMNDMVENYFGNSARQLVSFFTSNHKINIKEADDIIKMLENLKKEQQ
ncbi:MAG TPA: BlaI/MecI/CopY family transcriptional regulator [Bacteroidales bacterium]|nr:BlaI/MecI/CopY family transcriptional regulator [Bacteroidales bacterium]